MEDWKIKIAVLWIVLEFGWIIGGIVGRNIPGFVEEHYAQTTPEGIVVIAVLMMIGPIMAFLSLTLKDSINRWTNIILGIVFAGFAYRFAISYPAAYSAFAILLTIVEFVPAALIVWYAWKSKQKT